MDEIPKGEVKKEENYDHEGDSHEDNKNHYYSNSKCPSNLEKDMPNTFSSNQEKIKNNLQTNLPLKVINKPPTGSTVKPQIQTISTINHKLYQENEKNTKLKYSGRSFSDDSQEEESKKIELENFTESEPSERIKPMNNNRNYNRSSSSEKEESPKREKAISAVPKMNQIAPKKQTNNIPVPASKAGSHHTAYTFSTIVKMKKETKPTKTSVFKEKVMAKKYNGKSDRVAIYQYLKNEWNKTPILKKKSTTKEDIKEREINVVTSQKVNPAKRPLSYKKF